jgi:demethylmenaquinone methyltransferase/2-methoxy-6-polyprenyl-1,4-benzoquinol methylase
MFQKIKPYQQSESGKKQQVTQMFNQIAKRYDALNRLVSAGSDIRWRNKVVGIVKKHQPVNVLDVATGTGDLAIALAKTNAEQIIGLDVAKNMLEVAEQKITKKNLLNVSMVSGDAESLPYSVNTFDAVTVSFGVRNFENLELGLTEIQRVLKENGLLVILETSVPAKFPFKQGYKCYTKYLMPAITLLFSKDKKAYQYLSKSANNFPSGASFCNILEKIGFNNVKCMPQTMGVATIYVAKK